MPRLNWGWRPLVAFLAVTTVAAAGAAGREYKFSRQERILLTRDLTAEYATAKITIPRSKKPLPVAAETGVKDMAKWSDAHQKYGSAARMGDVVQITKIQFQPKRIILELNGGFKGGRKWYDRIQIGGGTGGGMTPLGRGNSSAAAGTRIALVFEDGVPELSAAEVKELLAPLMDFERHTAVEQYVDSLPEPIQAAIKEKRAVEDMDRDAVVVSMGKPVRKIRETKDGIEYEDWIYGTPPGKVTFVTFKGSKVVKVREAYGGLGGSVAPPLPAK